MRLRLFAQILAQSSKHAITECFLRAQIATHGPSLEVSKYKKEKIDAADIHDGKGR